jgi:hypothetical protein
VARQKDKKSRKAEGKKLRSGEFEKNLTIPLTQLTPIPYQL